MFRKFISSAALVLALAVSLSAQNQAFYEKIAQDHNRAGISAHSYEPSDTAVSQAPKGYKAFYVSHIGRHGSRYQIGKEPYAFVTKLQEYADAGLLTELGMQVLKEVKAMDDATEGNIGMLTERGALEHRQIAGRLVRHYPEIFTNPSRTSVNSYDTHVRRVVASRDNFLSVVKTSFPSLEVNIVSPDKTDKDKRMGVSGQSIPAEAKKASDAGKTGEEYKAARDAAMKGLKRVSRKVQLDKIFASTPEKLDSKLVNSIYAALNMGRCVGIDMPACESLFDDNAFYYNWASSNLGWYYNYCNCPENPTKPAFNYAGKAILKRFVEDADAAVKEDSKVAADFRFSHDTKVLPFIAVVAPETCCYSGSLSNVNEHIFLPNVVCMGCNMQWIFYRNAQNQILVKVLQNEKEVLIPGVKSFDGPYYRWSDLRKDLLKKCE